MLSVRCGTDVQAGSGSQGGMKRRDLGLKPGVDKVTHGEGETR